MMLTGALVGVVTSVVAAAWLRQWAVRRRITRKVGAREEGAGREAPPVGGLALALGFAAGLITAELREGMTWSPQLLGLLAGGAVLLAVGLIDDFVRELRPWQKLLGQCVAWGLLVRGGIVMEVMFLPSWANLLVSLLWTLAIVNAFNLLDIADGLAGGIGWIAAVTFLILGASQPDMAGLLLVICGALGGVLLFFWRKTRLILGDSGSMLLGFLLAAVSVVISYATPGREVALLTPLLVLGLPLYDLIFVVLMRLRGGRPIFQKSRDHFVFRLIRQGWPPSKAVGAMLGLCTAFCGAALIVYFGSNAVGAVAATATVMVTVAWGIQMANVPVDA